jgi:hypothetical protein
MRKASLNTNHDKVLHSGKIVVSTGKSTVSAGPWRRASHDLKIHCRGFESPERE